MLRQMDQPDLNQKIKEQTDSTICLNMIVKDESHIIEKTLTTLVQHINFAYWVISDTGSTDNTVEIIENFFKKQNIPGEIKHDKWVDFSHNRNLALQAAKDKAEYLFIFDADDDISGNLQLPNKLIDDSYLLKFVGGGSEYFRPLLIKSDLDWKWEGVLHEYLTLPVKFTSNYFVGDYWLTSGRSGSRNQDPDKYLKDAKVLERAYYAELEKPEAERNQKLLTRYSFYCAQSYRDCEHRTEAVQWYRNTININAWIQEVYYAHLMAGRLLIELNRPEEAITHWIQGQALNVGRAECYYEIAKYYRTLNNMHMAYDFGLLAKRVSVQSGGLFFETHIHNYLIDYEITLSAYYANEIQAGLKSCQALLQNCEDPYYIKVTEDNIKYYQ